MPPYILSNVLDSYWLPFDNSEPCMFFVQINIDARLPYTPPLQPYVICSAGICDTRQELKFVDLVQVHCIIYSQRLIALVRYGDDMFYVFVMIVEPATILKNWLSADKNWWLFKILHLFKGHIWALRVIF